MLIIIYDKKKKKNSDALLVFFLVTFKHNLCEDMIPYFNHLHLNKTPFYLNGLFEL